MVFDLQTIAALTIVIFTAIIMLWVRLRKKDGSCGGGCGCSGKSSQKNIRS